MLLLSSSREKTIMAYDQLRYSEVSMKGAHNSYQRDETIIEQLQWNPARPYEAGCRALELDISQSSTGNQWSVGHKSSYDPHYRQLSQFLSELRAYSRANPGHDPVTLYLDLKHVAGSGFPDQLDQYIRAHLDVGTGTTVYTPGELMGSAASLPEGARRNGWPTLGALRNRFLIVLTGDGDAKALYARTSPRARLCFADKDMGADKKPESTDRVFFNYHLYSSDKGKWCPVFRAAAGRPDAVIRGYVLNGEGLWNDALACGCHVLATDKIKGHSWAKVGNEPFVRLKPLPVPKVEFTGIADPAAVEP
jgi:hypothetical protein